MQREQLPMLKPKPKRNTMKINGIEITEAFAEPQASNIIDVINPNTDRGAYSNETFEEIRKRHPNAQRYNLDQWIADTETRENPMPTWTETTKEAFQWGLECLPPALWENGFLLVGEPSDHHGKGGAPRFPAYKHTPSGYFSCSRPLSKAEIRKMMTA
jgi:hypothetical protein